MKLPKSFLWSVRRRGRWILPAILAAVLFIGGVASNLVATYIQLSLDNHKPWVWGLFGIALTVAIIVTIRDWHSLDSTDAISVNATASQGGVLASPQRWLNDPTGNSAKSKQILLEAKQAVLEMVQNPASCNALSLDQANVIKDHKPTDLIEYYVGRIAQWSLPQYHLDKRFVNLTLLLDKGEGEPQRWQRTDSFRFNNLSDVLEHTKEYPSLVLLGAPGNGKSTLLRRLQLDHSANRLRDGEEQVSFYIQLNGYRAHSKEALPEPREWLGSRWAALYPQLPPLKDFLQQGRVLLLLDAINEMPHKNAADYRMMVGMWRAFAQEAAGQGNRLVFSCRSLDYSASLSSPDLRVPQVEVQPMNVGQVRDFLKVYIPDHECRVWKELEGSPQFGLFQTPYFLKLLCEQVEASGDVPKGRVALFTGFVRQALGREINTELFHSEILLSELDRQKLNLGEWRSPFELPERGALIPKLADLAFSMQVKGLETEGAQVRIDYDEACEKVAHDRAEEILKAGIALNVLDKDVAQLEIIFFHQLLQEYFAARRLSKEPQSELVQVECDAERVSPTLAKTLANLADGDPLPPLGQTGWEETTLTAAPMAKDPAKFIRDLMSPNLPLAARCASLPEVWIGEGLKRDIQNALIARTMDQTIDLRARIAAGEALGIIGDPRFERRNGPHGEYILPPTVTIAAGTYSVGDDESVYDVEKPKHTVGLGAFHLGQFPVTNAEYDLFMKAGGYEDERWWDTVEAKAWRKGEGTAEGAKQAWREDRKTFQGWTEEYIHGLVKQNRISWKQAEDWITMRNWSEEYFEQELSKRYDRDARLYRRPEFWEDTRFNNYTQPVVGVTWFEARAYCNWLTANVGEAVAYRLPTEAEFEAAARGIKGRMFPYGDEFDVARSNTFESHIRRTTPVGIFDNVTPEGAFDLSGNVYTWTLSIYDQKQYPYPYRSDDGRDSLDKVGVNRVLRGGSWSAPLANARTVYRNYVLPAFRDDDIGFRVVVARSLLPR
jgi:formylglycine-generating enzyme required for sulfatase activity